jgi:hypothetical protein
VVSPRARLVVLEMSPVITQNHDVAYDDSLKRLAPRDWI